MKLRIQLAIDNELDDLAFQLAQQLDVHQMFDLICDLELAFGEREGPELAQRLADHFSIYQSTE